MKYDLESIIPIFNSLTGHMVRIQFRDIDVVAPFLRARKALAGELTALKKRQNEKGNYTPAALALCFGQEESMDILYIILEDLVAMPTVGLHGIRIETVQDVLNLGVV